MNVDANIIDLIVKVAAEMDRKGFMNYYDGNISVKKDGLLYITPTAHEKIFLTPADICVFDEDDNQLAGNCAPSSEYGMHKACYTMRDDIGAVMHTHAPFCTAFATLNRKIESKAYMELIATHKIVEVAPYGVPGTEDLYKDVPQIFKKGYKSCLLANHGALSVGSDLYEAMGRMISIENGAKILTIMKILGGEPVDLDKVNYEGLFNYDLIPCL